MAVVGQVDKVDVVAVAPDGRVRVIMTQVDHWDDSDDQLLALQEKVNNYLSFVLDGQITQAYPTIDATRWLVRLDCQTQPPPRTASLLDTLADVVKSEGGEFEVSLLGV